MSRGLPEKVRSLMEKAKESALLAVDVYNKPKTSFRSGGFIILMCVAWTALIHAKFEKEGIRYFYKKTNGRYEIIDGERKAWTLLDSLPHVLSEDSPVKKNLEFFVQLRNKIEHRFMPKIDPEISGECQALILNFESFLIAEFGEKNSLIENLFIPMQLTREQRSLPDTKDEKFVLKFIRDFRSTVNSGISNTQEFSFKAFLVPKLGNHRSSSNIAIEFVKFDPNNAEEMEQYEKMIVGIKEKMTPVANLGKYRPGKIVEILKEKGFDATVNWHTSMWKKHRVRPPFNSANKKDCNAEYCQFDESSTHGDYVYTDKWVDLLQAEISGQEH